MSDQPISLRAFLAAHGPEPSSDYDSDPITTGLANELAGWECPRPCTYLQGFLWECAWRAKARVLRADALIAALNATESKAAAYTSPLLKAWNEASVECQESWGIAGRAETRAQVAEDAVLEAQLAAKRAETRAQVAEDALANSKVEEARLRLYIDKLRKAGDDYGRDEDGKWWAKIRNEQP